MQRAVRNLVAVLATVTLVVGAFAATDIASPTPAAASPAAAVGITYSVGRAGSVSTDVGGFAAHVASTLDDPRGWPLGGSLDFQPVASGGSFRVLIAEPAVIGRQAGCSAQYSCHVQGTVYINEQRWNTGAPGWSGSLDAYRHYVVNHEVGHYLGLGHRSCPGSGAAAPVMMQQTISTAPCVNRVWPLASERQAVAARYGVVVRGPSFAFVRSAYQRLLHRSPSDGDATALAARIDRGEISEAAAATNLVTSAEFDAVSGAVGRLYFAAFQRAPEPTGTLYWGRQVQAGYSIRSVAADFARSREFRARYGDLDTAGFVDRLYRNVLGRRADDSGRRYWIRQIDSGAASRGDVLHLFAESSENRRLRRIDVDVSLYYALILDTKGDPAGIRYWTEQLERGTRRLDVVAAFLASHASVL